MISPCAYCSAEALSVCEFCDRSVCEDHLVRHNGDAANAFIAEGDCVDVCVACETSSQPSPASLGKMRS